MAAVFIISQTLGLRSMIRGSRSCKSAKIVQAEHRQVGRGVVLNQLQGGFGDNAQTALRTENQRRQIESAFLR